MATVVVVLHGFYDKVVKLEVPLSLGFTKPSPSSPFGSSAAFGTPGAGGSFGFADLQAAVGYAYVTNRMGRELRLLDDARDLALRKAFQQAIGTRGGCDGVRAASKSADLRGKVQRRA